jgi:fructokinase
MVRHVSHSVFATTSPQVPEGAVTVIGEALIDLVPDGTPDGFAAHPGGSPYNVAIGLARLGIDTCLMARLGDNAFGRILRDRARAEGIDLGAAPQAAELTTLAVVSLDSEARATYDFYTQGTADWHWTAEEIARLPNRTTILHFGSLASWTAPGAQQIALLVRRARAAGAVIVSYDPNVRPLLLKDPERSRAAIEPSIELAHIVKASTEDVQWLYPGAAPDDVADRWLELGPALVVLTDGASGACAYTSGARRIRRPGISVDVIDTVGAGDSFTSALLASCLRRGINAPARFAGWAESDITGVLDDAITASALTCRRAGADPPSAADLVSLSSPA